MPRDPLTATERRLKGTRPRHRRTVGVVTPPAKPPPAPRGLGPAGRRLWRLAWREAHWLVEGDRVLLEVACRRLDEIERLEAILARDGDIVAGSKGQPVPHPATRIRSTALDVLRGALNDLGLSAIARRRLGIATQRAPEVVDAVERFLERTGPPADRGRTP
jgi:P27 family predicted phage terminase small subunit